MGFKIVSRYQRIKCVYFKTLNVVLIFWITTKLTLKTQRQQQKISASVSVSYKSKELGWLTYLSNFLSPTDQKVGGGQIFFSRSARKIVPHPLSKPWRRPWGHAPSPLGQRDEK